MSKLVNYTLNRVQITCPNCKYEFPYNKQTLQQKIDFLGHKIKCLNDKIRIIPKNPEHKRQPKIAHLKRLLEQYEAQISDLKLIRETLKDQEERMVLNNLKQVIKEFVDDDTYVRCMDEALRRTEAYKIENMMGIGYYSHSKGTRIRKVS